MPLYEYQCQQCEHRFERIERASAIHDGVCPVCNGSARRLLGAPALKFKGSGWYVTDYGKGDASRPSTGDTAPATGEAETAAAADSKPKKDQKTTAASSDSKVA